MASEKQAGTQAQKEQGGDFLSASSYQEQGLRNNNSIGDKGRDESTQAGDFLRGSRGDEPSSALMQVLHDHRYSDCQKTSSTSQSNSKESAAAVAGEKSSDGVETQKEKVGDIAWEEANGKGVERESFTHHMPHQEVPQPGQYTDMDAAVEFVALVDI